VRYRLGYLRCLSPRSAHGVLPAGRRSGIAVAQPANNVMLLRAGIVAAGPLIAVLIVVGSRSWSRRPR